MPIFSQPNSSRSVSSQHFVLFSRISAVSVIALVAAFVLVFSCIVLVGCTGQETSDESSVEAFSSKSTSQSEAYSEEISSSVEQSNTSHVSDKLNTETLFFFDTVLTISAYCDDETLDAVAERCEFFDDTFSRTVEGSDVWNINHAAGEPTEVNPETADIISRALVYAEQTDGLFDITIGAVSSLWDFVEGVKPSDEQIQAAVQHVDWHCVTVDGTTVTLTDPEAMIDLGGIAKGYIADYVKQMLIDAGVESATINLGGDVTVLGVKPDGSQWNVGIQDPNGSSNDVIASVRSTESVVTSGLYERGFVEDGVRYYHILDPSTGYPVQTDLESASILSSSATDGDVYATTMFLLGSKAAQEFIDAHDDLEGLLIDKDGEITMTAGADFVLL